MENTVTAVIHGKLMGIVVKALAAAPITSDKADGSFNSAVVCFKDARSLLTAPDGYFFGRKRALQAIAYAVGIFNPLYAEATALIEGIA